MDHRVGDLGVLPRIEMVTNLEDATVVGDGHVVVVPAAGADPPSDVTISGSAAALALLAYGRYDLATLFGSGEIRLDGDAALAERFSALFPRP